MNDEETKRVVTSAIDGMSVTEVRRGLDLFRRKWKERTHEDCTFFLCEPVLRDMNIEQFAFRFVVGHHHKRKNREGERPEASKRAK